MKRNSKLKPRCLPSRAIRYRCRDCLGEIYDKDDKLHVGPDAVTHCDLDECALYNYRMGRKTAEAHSRTKAIRRECLCRMCGQSREIKLCVAPECSLFEYRFGRYPTEEEILAVREVQIHGRDKELWEPKLRPVVKS